MKDSPKEFVLEGSAVPTEQELARARGLGISRILLPPGTEARRPPGQLEPVFVSDEDGPDRASWVRVSGPAGVERALQASSRDQAFVVVECSDWKVIPLENLIAEYRRRGKRIYAYADSKGDISTALAILEKGVDGVVLPPRSLDAVETLASSQRGRLTMVRATVTRIIEAGVGDRTCIDTTSELEPGEGMLVGSRGGFFFLVHGETLASEYIPPRPFRVNAGSLHSYTLLSDGKTRYLSELESPDFVTIVDPAGNHREASVGRVKVERRPLLFVEASTGSGTGSVVLQKAETIRLVREGGEPVSVTELKPGDAVLVHQSTAGARHFGGEVDERIVEK